MRGDDPGRGQAASQLRGELTLVARVTEREEEADGDGLGLDLAQGLEVERAKHPLRTDPLGDSEAALQRHQRLGVVLAEPIEMRSRLPAEVEEVLEPLCRDEGRPRALALEQRVRGDGRPVREALEVAGADRAGRGEHGLLLARGGRHLRGRDPALVDEDGVSEGAADIDAENAHVRKLPVTSEIAFTTPAELAVIAAPTTAAAGPERSANAG